MSARYPSNGYEGVAEQFIRARSEIGSATVRDWAAQLPNGAHVLDLGCGHGDPNIPILLDVGCRVSAIDAAPSLLSVLKDHYPEVETACEPVETSDFFGRKFNGILAVGLIFLLPRDAQSRLIQNVSDALKPGGRFLVSAPQKSGSWEDLVTKRRSVSLGDEIYRTNLLKAGFEAIESRWDRGGSHYYSAQKA